MQPAVLETFAPARGVELLAMIAAMILLVVHSCMAHQLGDAESAPQENVRRIDLAERYTLEFTPPSGWLTRPNAYGVELVTSLPAWRSSVALDFYKPYNSRDYLDFGKWIAEAFKHARRNHRSARLRHLVIEKFPAAEISFVAGDRQICVTYLAVPYVGYAGGEVYVIFFEGPTTPEGRQDLAAYHALIGGARIR